MDNARDSSTVGIVESVGPNVIEVAITREAPHGSGLIEGQLHRFPRLNGLVVLPSERGSVLAIITWVGVVTEPTGIGDGGTDRLGLPRPRRRLRAQPLGVLVPQSSVAANDPVVALDRGVLVFPTVGDPVRLPSVAEAKAIVPRSDPASIQVRIGRAPLAGNAPVLLDPSRLFGRHLAVLGNTGSGKSCTVAQLLRSSAAAVGDALSGFRAIVLDLNGEYESAFEGLHPDIECQVLRVVVPERAVEDADKTDDDSVDDDLAHSLRVPYWLWNFQEWLSFSDASSKSQAPLLRRSLHLLRTNDLQGLPPGIVRLIAGRRVVRQYNQGAVGEDGHKACMSVLDDALSAARSMEAEAPRVMPDLLAALASVLEPRRGGGQYRWAFTVDGMSMQECEVLEPLFSDCIAEVGLPEFLGDGFTVDSPRPFQADLLLELLPLMAAEAGPDAVGWVAPLVERLRITMNDDRLDAVCGWRPGEDVRALLQALLGDGTSNQVTVVDLSLVPTHVLHVVVAVLARFLLEGLERHRRIDGESLIPTLLVVEEAHAVVRRHLGGSTNEENVSAAQLCRHAFERIAREGRKFGLSMVLSSQRPSELSETVLSQCNTFVVHRIVNDHDQQLVRRLMPDSLGALVDELPSLPSQTALVVGWALEVPTLIRVDDLEPSHRPRSADPDFTKAWRGGAAADWAAVAAAWDPTSVRPAGNGEGPGPSTDSSTGLLPDG